MQKIVALILLFCSVASQSHADTACPERYRFVDFGLEGRDSILRRGGTVLRAFDENNTHLLIPDQTICVKVESLATDGRALPVPVVSKIAFDSQLNDLGLALLEVETVADAIAVAQTKAKRHNARLTLSQTYISRGHDFLCAGSDGGDDISCQVVSPYGGSAPLVVYCHATQCEMQALAIDKQLLGRAVWSRHSTDPDTIGTEVSDTIQRIFGFFETRF